MTDKERIEVYVSELPKCCHECVCCNVGYEEGVSCNLCEIDMYEEVGTKLGKDGETEISIYKYETLPKECHLKTIQSIQNAKAVDALEKVQEFMGNYIDQNDDFDKLWKYVENLIKEYGGKYERRIEKTNYKTYGTV